MVLCRGCVHTHAHMHKHAQSSFISPFHLYTNWFINGIFPTPGSAHTHTPIHVHTYAYMYYTIVGGAGCFVVYARTHTRQKHTRKHVYMHTMHA